MSHKSPSAEALSITNETLASREPFFEDDVTIDTHDVFCGDKRGVIGIDTYIHLFGGGLNAPYNLAVLQEAARPGSVTEAFDEHAASVIPMALKAGVKLGIHSDRDSEQGEWLHIGRTEGPIGCVYARERSQISGGIAARSEEIVSDSASLRPELFTSPEDYDFAYAVADAHGRLASRAGFSTDGRRAVLAAAEAGAKVGVVEGDTEAKVVGIINLKPQTSLKSKAALEAGVPAYLQDSWAAAEIFDRLREDYPHDGHQARIAELIDTVGTFRALGVQDIAVRRPANLI